MNLILSFLLISGVDLFFLKDSPDLLVRVAPSIQIEQLTLYYFYSGTGWDSVVVDKKGQFFDAVLKTPDTLHVVGIYCMYDNGFRDDNNGELYLYEVKIFPRMLMPFSLEDLDVMLKQARKKITEDKHVDEAITLLRYVENMLETVPVLKDSQGELKRDMLRIEVNNLRGKLGK